jgi:hypothetical protein
MSIRLYIIPIDIDIYNIVEPINISDQLKMLNKYSPFIIDKPYSVYNLKNDYKVTQTLISSDKLNINRY